MTISITSTVITELEDCSKSLGVTHAKQAIISQKQRKRGTITIDHS